MIGLAGAHRTGKTSLARASARVLGVPFVETSVSGVFQAMGLDPAEPMDFQTRLLVQNVVLKTCMEKWYGYKDGFLTDRTPIDMLAYTMADIQGSVLDETTEVLMASYIQACIKACNDFFALILLVQPGIPLVAAEGKAAMSPGYMEHLNAIMAGLMARKDLKPTANFIARSTLDLDARVNCVVNAYKRMIKQGLQQSHQAALLH